MDYDVAVVGAGFAGLSTAVRLAGMGARVLVLESRSRLGGRATALADRESGELVDNGQHVLVGAYRETFAFLRAIDTLESVTLQPNLNVAMIDRQARLSRLICSSPLPAPYHLVAGVFDWEALSWADRLAVLRMAGPLRIAAREGLPGSRKIAASPGETVENWLIRNGQTERICEMLWNPLALAALNQQPSQAAAPPFVRVLAEMFASDTKASAIGLPNRPLHEVYAEPARRYIEARGGRVLTGSAARIDLARASRAAVVAGAERWAPEYVIAAVPWHALPDLFQGDVGPLASVLDAARRTGACPIVTANLWFDRPILGEAFVGLPGRQMQWAFEKPAATDGGFHLALVASGAAALVDRTNDELVALAHRELLEARPALRKAALLRANVVREPRATFSLAPGQPARPRCETAIPGLYLAGDWIDTGLPATIESAVRSGHRAADLVSAA